MATISVYIPDDMREKMKQYDDINWSIVARKSIERRLEMLAKLDIITENSELTEEDAIALGRSIRKGIRKRNEASR